MMAIGSRFAICFAPMALAGCASPATQILTLDAIGPAPMAVRTDYRGLPLTIPAVPIPAALDRIEFVSEMAAGKAKIDDFAHWGAPLGMLVRDALVRDLIARLPQGAVLPPGSAAKPGVAREIDVSILAFDSRTGLASMQVEYRLAPSGRFTEAEFKTGLDANEPAASARAFAVLIAQLSDRIASEIK